jgi:hypothetical protein
VNPSREPTAQDRAIAEALFRDGKALIEADRVEDACLKFQESQRLEPALGTMLYLATCYALAGKTASAWAAFQSVAEAAHRAKDSSRESLARERARQLEAHLSRLEISASASVKGIVIHVDERALGPGVFSTPLPFDPGLHLIEVTAPRKSTWSQTVELPKGPVTIKVQVPILEGAAVQTETVPAPTEVKGVDQARLEQPSPGFNWRLVGAVSLGLGGAGVLAGSYFGARAYSQAKDADQQCVGQVCARAGLDGHAEARRSAAWANASFGMGLIALATGGYLMWFHDAKTNQRQSALWLGTGAGEIAVGGEF